MMRLLVVILTFSICPISNIAASDLVIDNIRVVNRADIHDNPISVIFDISWNNAWSNDKNHDAVWVFIKFGGYWDNHAKLSPTGHRILQNRTDAASPMIEVSDDSLGFFIYPDGEHRGTMDFKLQVLLDTTHQTINWNKINVNKSKA